MTKTVRIENADMSNFKLTVEVWDKGYPEGESDKLSETRNLDYPTQLLETHVTSSRYLVIKERSPEVLTQSPLLSQVTPIVPDTTDTTVPDTPPA